MRVAINGLGRIGRLMLRALLEQSPNGITIAALNSPGDGQTIAHLLNYDSVHGRGKEIFSYEDGKIIYGSSAIPLFAERDPANLPWDKLNIDLVIECSGKFNSKAESLKHTKAGAKKVLVSAPCKDADVTIVIGVNDNMITNEHIIISAASCTTNALAPIAKIMSDCCGIENGHVTTVHAYTGDQNLVDNSHKDLRRARSGCLSIIPTKTGAADALKLVLPELAGKIKGTALRVPTPNVSLIDLTFNAERATSIEAINARVAEEAAGRLKNIISVANAKLVSIDFNHSDYSVIFDPFETTIVGDKLVRTLSWYDNEWGFVCRMLDICKLIRDMA